MMDVMAEDGRWRMDDDEYDDGYDDDYSYLILDDAYDDGCDGYDDDYDAVWLIWRCMLNIMMDDG